MGFFKSILGFFSSEKKEEISFRNYDEGYAVLQKYLNEIKQTLSLVKLEKGKSIDDAHKLLNEARISLAGEELNTTKRKLWALKSYFIKHKTLDKAIELLEELIPEYERNKNLQKMKRKMKK